MATSTKVMFKLHVLHTKALESIDHRIAVAESELAAFLDDEALKLQIIDWRARQEERIANLFRRLGDDQDAIGDHELSKWSVEKIPHVDYWDKNQAERKVRELKAKRSQIVAKAEALVPDDEGNIALTKTQLSEFFGL